jgi:hypothetical protein
VKRRIALLAAFAAVATACGNAQSDDAVAPAASCKSALVRVTVMNGDTHKPVRGARVHVSFFCASGRTGGDGNLGGFVGRSAGFAGVSWRMIHAARSAP